jgi:hypothetical protein
MVSGANQHYSPSNCAGRKNLDTSAAAPLRVCLIATHFAEYGYALAQSLARSADVLVVASEENTKRIQDH